MSQNNLIKILKKNNVHISKKGNICLYDFVDKIIKSKNPDLYMKKIKCKIILIDGEKYIAPKDCVEILGNAKFKECKEIFTKIQVDDGDKSSIIDVDKNIFQFEGHRFMSYFVNKEDGDWDVWVKGVSVALFLKYVDKDQAISEHVKNQNKLKFKELCEKFESVKKTGTKNIHPNTIFINLSGFLNLIHHSKKSFAEKIRNWLDNEVVPSLIKYGEYVMQPKKLDIKSYYDDGLISKFDGKSVLYIGYIGVRKGVHMFKFGLSRKMFLRDYKQHRKTYGKFELLYVEECDNCQYIEELFKKELRARNLERNLIIGDKNKVELFTISNKFTHQYFIDLMKELIETHKLPAIENANNKIENLNNVVNTYKNYDELEKIKCDIEKLKYQYKLSDNYKLQLETDLRIKEIDSDTKISLKNLDLDIEKEKSKQVAMSKGVKINDEINYLKKKINKPKIIEL